MIENYFLLKTTALSNGTLQNGVEAENSVIVDENFSRRKHIGPGHHIMAPESPVFGLIQRNTKSGLAK